MDKYTHRIRIGATQLQHRYDFEDITINRYHKDDYLYGYYADGMLIGDVVEFHEEYVTFEYWISLRGKQIERIE